MAKTKTVELYEEWRKGWASPDIYVKIDQRKAYSTENRILLRGHTEGEYPFVKYKGVPIR